MEYKKIINDNIMTLEFTVDKETFIKNEDKVFNEMKNKLSPTGFRKGKATKQMIKQLYGKDVFLRDTVDECINDIFHEYTYKNCDEQVISMPKIELMGEIGDDNFQFKVKLFIVPEINIKNYKNVKIKKQNTDVQESEINDHLKNEQEKNGRIVEVDREAKSGDVLLIDYEGYVDNEKFSGGTDKNATLELGSNSFIPGFEEQLIGAKKGDDKDINVVFPTPYFEKSLEGKNALFKVHINSVKQKELPDIDDEFISEISEFDNIDDYKKDLKEKLQKEKETKLINEYKNEIIEEISKINNFTFPEEAMQYKIDTMLDGINEQYHAFKTEQDRKDFYDEHKQSLDKVAKEDLNKSYILKNVARMENIDIDNEKVQKSVDEFLKMSYITDEKYKAEFLKNKKNPFLMNQFVYPVVLDFLYENANIK